MTSRKVEYHDGDTLLEGCAAWPSSEGEPRPLVVVCHAWGGRDELADDKARALSQLGYVGFALDVFGKGVRGASPQENASLIRPFMEDRPMLLRRLRSGVAHAQTLPGVDPDRTAVIGFCFGGLCALDLARSGDPLRAAIAFHGLFDPPPAPFGDAISAKVLALHGWDDPMVPPEKVTALADELSRAGADWQIHAYGNTVHAFTNPAMHAKDEGKAYDERADRRSWRAMTDMLAEALA